MDCVQFDNVKKPRFFMERGIPALCMYLARNGQENENGRMSYFLNPVGGVVRADVMLGTAGVRCMLAVAKFLVAEFPLEWMKHWHFMVFEKRRC